MTNADDVYFWEGFIEYLATIPTESWILISKYQSFTVVDGDKDSYVVRLTKNTDGSFALRVSNGSKHTSYVFKSVNETTNDLVERAFKQCQQHQLLAK